MALNCRQQSTIARIRSLVGPPTKFSSGHRIYDPLPTDFRAGHKRALQKLATEIADAFEGAGSRPQADLAGFQREINDFMRFLDSDSDPEQLEYEELLGALGELLVAPSTD